MTTEKQPSSRLFYAGTREEVRLGDRVRMRRWFRRALEGVVCYIPGLSAPHPDFEYPGTREWVVELQDGSMRVMGYYPDQIQPPREMELVERGAPFTPPDPSKKRLEEWGEYEEDDEPEEKAR